jgi:hypothetical protein
MLPLMIASIASPLVSHRQHRQSDGCKGGNNVNLGIVSKERKKRQPMNFLRVRIVNRNLPEVTLGEECYR